jgi:HAD superfamily hydrolase (TIGR01509 family)
MLTLFDFNGVLVDDEAVHLAAFREVLGSLGVTLTDEEYVERYLGYDDVGAFRAILADRGKPAAESEIAALVQAKKPAYMRRAERELVIFEGALHALDACARRGPTGIVSGALRHEIEFALARMGGASLVAFIVSAEDTSRCKPDPEGYLCALDALASRGASGRPDPRSVLVIEDSLAGIEAAKAAGMRCAAVAHSYAKEALARAGADWVLPTIADIDDRWLDQIGALLLK